MSYPGPRALGAFGATLCLAALLIAYFILQQHLGLLPCPLCIIDRFIIAALGCGFLCVAIFDKAAVRVTALLSNCVWRWPLPWAAGTFGWRPIQRPWMRPAAVPPEATSHRRCWNG